MQKNANKGRKSISTGQKKAVILHRILNYIILWQKNTDILMMLIVSM